MIADQVGRAYGVMMHSYSISSKEVLNLLSMLRLGVDLASDARGIPRHHR